MDGLDCAMVFLLALLLFVDPDLLKKDFQKGWDFPSCWSIPLLPCLTGHPPDDIGWEVDVFDSGVAGAGAVMMETYDAML